MNARQIEETALEARLAEARAVLRQADALAAAALGEAFAARAALFRYRASRRAEPGAAIACRHRAGTLL